MPGQHVQPEVGGRIPPHRVRVVGASLRVVPLDQQSRALEPVVVRLSRPRWSPPRRSAPRPGRRRRCTSAAATARPAPGPGRCRAGPGGSRAARGRDRPRRCPWVRVVYDTVTWSSGVSPAVSSIRSLRACSLACSTGSGNRSSAPDAGQRDHLVTVGDDRAVGRDEVRRRLGQQDRLSRRVAAQGRDELAGEVLHPGQRPVDRPAEQRRRGRVGPEEQRRGRDQTPVHDQVVQRDVVAAEPPAPRRARRRVRRTPAGSRAPGRGPAPGRTGSRNPRSGRARSPVPWSSPR